MPALGRLVIQYESFEPNLEKYDIVSFEFGGFVGSGDAEFFTLDNSFKMTLTAQAAEGGEVALSGEAPVISVSPLGFGEFSLTGEGVAMMFAATAE